MTLSQVHITPPRSIQTLSTTGVCAPGILCQPGATGQVHGFSTPRLLIRKIWSPRTRLRRFPSPQNSIGILLMKPVRIGSRYLNTMNQPVLCTTSVVLDKTITTSPPYTVTSALPRLANLCWRVRSVGLYGYSNWSTDITEFQTSDPPYAPSLTSPGNGVSLATFAPVLAWGKSPYQSSTHPTRTANEYQIQVSTSSSFPDTIIDKIVSGGETKLQLGATDLDLAGTYYWRVRACFGSDPLPM